MELVNKCLRVLEISSMMTMSKGLKEAEEEEEDRRRLTELSQDMMTTSKVCNFFLVS